MCIDLWKDACDYQGDTIRCGNLLLLQTIAGNCFFASSVRRSSDPQVAYAECEIGEPNKSCYTVCSVSVFSLLCVKHCPLFLSSSILPRFNSSSSGDTPSNNVCHDYEMTRRSRSMMIASSWAGRGSSSFSGLTTVRT